MVSTSQQLVTTHWNTDNCFRSKCRHSNNRNMASSAQKPSNPEDSEGDSDLDDIVLDQSLTVHHGATAPVLAPPQIPPVQPAMLAPVASTVAVDPNASQSVAPTIVTIAPPTLKSSKGEVKGTLPPPPIPFRDSLHGATTGTAQPAKAKEVNNGVPPIPRDVEEDDDHIVRPRVDPKLLRLMSLDGKIEADEIASFDVDVSILAERPWAAAGADITDYFNYGFNERTWREYCCAQLRFRKCLQSQSGNVSNHQTFSHQPVPPPQPLPVPHHSHPHPHSHSLSQTHVHSQSHQPQQQQQQQQPPTRQHQHPHGHAPGPLPQNPIPSAKNISMPSHIAAHPHVHPSRVIPRTAPSIVVNNPTPSVPNKERETAEEIRPQKSMEICYDFQNKGHCHRGASCRWTHQKGNQQGQCFEWENKGTCGWGAQCRWKHGGHQSAQKQDDKATNDELQARLRLILGEAPNIPHFVESMKLDDVEESHKKRKKRRKSRRKRSRSRSSVSRSRSRD